MIEEGEELKKARFKKDVINELVDILEIIDNIIIESRIDKSELMHLKKSKKSSRGGFEKKVFLESVTEQEIRLCSACLLGVNCRYNGKAKPNKKVLKLSQEEILIPVCPEVLGGQSTPRPNAEIRDGRVFEPDGTDVTDFFVRGAEEVLSIAKLYNIKEAILKQRSPSCGSGQLKMMDGSVKKGDGITTALLKRNGISVTSEEDL